MAGKIIADTIESAGSQISLNVGNVTILTASSTGLTLTPTTNVNINLTNSIVTLTNGSATSPGLTFSGNTRTGLFMPSANTLAFTAANTESMRIDSSGNVGIGGQPLSGHKLNLVGTAATVFPAWGVTGTTTAGAYAQFINTGSTTIIGIESSAGASLCAGTSAYASIFGTSSATSVQFVTNNNTRATIDSSGNLLVGTTSALSQTGRATFVSAGNVLVTQAGNSQTAYQSTNTSGTAAYYAAIWSNNGNTFTTCGTIQVSGSTTSYGTSSDYRLKQNIAPMTGALNKVALLKPVTYKWKTDVSDGQGFIAHELAEVCPQAVNGEKDALKEDGSIMPQGIDTSFLVATLTAAIQELKVIVDAQAVEIAALKAK